MSLDIDIGPLSWVKGEIDLALERAASALAAHAANADPDGKELTAACTHLHQAHGALAIVGLDGITEFSAALEKLFPALSDGGTVWSDSGAQAAQDGLTALRGYLDGLMGGEPNQPLKLFPAYAALLTARGEPAPGPATLFFPDLTQRPPRREVEPSPLTPDKLLARLKMARMAFERGLLKWIKGEARGIVEMRNAVGMIEATQLQPAGRAFWWAALGFYDALAAGALPESSAVDVKKLALKIGALIKKLVDGSATADAVPDRLMAEMLYHVGIASGGGDQVGVVCAAYRLANLIPRPANADAETLRPQIRRLRETLAGAKDDWNKLCAGSAAALPPFHEKITLLAERGADIGQADIGKLTAALSTLADVLRRDPSRHTDSMAIEVATALLLADTALENFDGLDADFGHQVDTVTARLDAVQRNETLGELALPQLDAMSRRAQERLLLATVAREMSANLGNIEQTLDAYFRDPTKQATLTTLSRPIKQVEGALVMLSQDRASAILQECAAQINDLAAGEPATPADFEDLARKLSALGFFVEQLESGSTPDIDAILNPAKPAVEAVTAAGAPPVPAGEPMAPAPAVLPPVPAVAVMVEPPQGVPLRITFPEATVAPVVGVETPPPAASDVDEELLGIFLEEANEVLGTIDEQLPCIHANPNDQAALTTLRRSFHTLKGSGRMVGLDALGEAAWGVEQVLNLWLQESRPVGAKLIALLDEAAVLFQTWVSQLTGGSTSRPDPTALASFCARLLGNEPEEPSAADMVAEMEARDEARTEALVTAAELANADIEAELAAIPRVEIGDIVDFDLELPTLEHPGEEPAAEAAPETGAEEVAVPDEATAVPPLVPASAVMVTRPAGSTLGVPTFPEEVPEAPEAAEPSAPPSDVRPFPVPPPVQVGELAISPVLYAIYLEEARGHLAAIQAEIGNDAVPSDALIRAAHTLGGISGTTGIMALHQLARSLETALGALAIVNVPPTDAQLFIFARCAGALEGMLGAVAQRRMPGEEAELANELRALQPQPAAAIAPLAPPPPTEFSLPVAPKPPEAAPTAASEASESIEERRARRIVDEIDEQLLPLFLEESIDLMASIGSSLRAWRYRPDDTELPRQLQRDLHTLKGSARMAGAMGCGELLHSMESRIEQAVAMKSVSGELLDTLETSHDRGAWLIDRLRKGESTEAGPAGPEAEVSVEAEPSAAEAVAVGTEPGGAVVGTPGTAAITVAPASAPSAQVHLRVRADLVDKLVNEAGEVNIARARIEGEMRGLKASLLELTENVIRLRGQVREIEIQAETQMASQQAHAAESGSDFDPLEFDRFTRMQELTRMLAESVSDVSTIQHGLLKNLEGADAALLAQARLGRELSQRLMSVRMVPFESLAERLHRVVRQSAKDCGKRANLDIRGGQAGVDRSVLEHIAAPLEHLLRNAVAHGLEDPDARATAGKPALGQITLSLAQEGNDIVLTLADDGGGLNLPRIRERGIERGLLAADAEADDKTLIGLIFQSGFSTAATLTAVAGRGVGMDVVKSEIENLGGRIEIATVAGKGSTFRLYLPLTLSITQAVIIKAGGRSYALPSSMIEQASELKPEAIAKVRTEGGTELLGRHYPWHYLPRLLGETQAQPIPARRHWLLLIKGGTDRVALEVDGLVGNQEIVVKSIGPQLARVPGLAGATVLGDGEIALIVNPIALLARTSDLAAEDTATPAAPALTDTQILRHVVPVGTVMVVDDSLTVRKITGRVLGRHGYQVVTAKDGVDALEQLTELHPDVMLVDIEMPRMDGFELSRNIRADAKLKDIPIIMITSRSADKHRKHAEEIGVNHYLGKPYDEQELLALIATYTQGRPT